MLGSQQAKIIGILRQEFEKDPKKILSIKEIHALLIQSYDKTQAPSYNTVATILKRLAEQQKVNSFENSKKYYYQYKDIQKQVSDRLLSTFVRAFGSSGINYLVERGKNLSEEDINDLTKMIDED